MRKTSVYLPDQLKSQLSALAARAHRSEADLIRGAVEQVVAAGAPVASSETDPPVAGRLVGIGVGPGSADLLTVRALRGLRRATAVVAPCTDVGAMGRAEAIVREAAPEVRVERLVFAMTPDAGARSAALRDATDRVIALLDDGEEVAFITLGDPNLYSTFSSVTSRLRAARSDTIVLTIPGVMAFQELAAASGTVLADDQQSFVVLPASDEAASAPDGAIAAALRDESCAVVVYKGGRHIEAVAARLRDADRLDGSVMGELLGLPGERVAAVADVADRPASYLSALIVPARATVISFVGAGPGAPDLITLRGADRLRNAAVVVWASSLVSESLLDHCRRGVELHDSAVMTLEDVLAVFASATDDTELVRLHSGDPSVYGAIAEQIDWCRANDRAFEIVPGVMSMSAAAAVLERELTVPQLSQSVVVTRLAGRTETSMRPGEGVAAFASAQVSMAVFLSGARPDELQAELLTGYPASTPAAVVVRVTWPDEHVVRTTVGEVADAIRSTGVDRTVLVLVGDALGDGTGSRAQPPVLPVAQHVVPVAESQRFDAGSAEPATAMSLTKVSVVGLHGGAWYGPRAETALRDADLLVGSARQLEDLAPASLPGTPVELWGRIDELAELCATRAADGTSVCVLASGDPGFFGIVRALAARVGRENLAVHPAPSSITLAFARVGIPWDDAVIATCHGRPIEPAAASVARHHKVAVLVSRDSPPEALGRAVLDAGSTDRDVWVCTRLGERDDSVTQTDLVGLASGCFDPLSVVVFVAPGLGVAPSAATGWGRDERGFAHRDGMITKAEVRAIVLGKLELPPDGVLWDVGAGSGSVGIEAARLVPALRVFSIERDPEAAAQIDLNAVGTKLVVVTGEAPDAFAALPDPDRIFLGGGGTAVLDAALDRVQPGGVVVATYATLGPALEAVERLDSLVQIAVNRAEPIGPSKHLRLRAENPVFVVWGTR